MDYEVDEKTNRHKHHVLAIGYVNHLTKKYNMHLPQALYHLIKLFYVSRYIRKHEKQATQLLLLCKKQNTYTQTFANQVVRVIDSRKKLLPRNAFYMYMNYQDAIGFTALMYLVQYMKGDILLSTILALLFTKGANTLAQRQQQKNCIRPCGSLREERRHHSND